MERADGDKPHSHILEWGNICRCGPKFYGRSYPAFFCGFGGSWVCARRNGYDKRCVSEGFHIAIPLGAAAGVMLGGFISFFVVYFFG
jgi:hypothetical protein